jgi:alpha-glucosidase (family GH31 glycosyl hydrolase)
LLPSSQDEEKLQPAIELWSLYAYNLHEATFQGLNRLPTQQGKRNFIIGRGSFAGMHRYAGLWTGDNGSSWDFLRITVTQALSLGLSGLVVVGGDVGGFMGMNKQKFCPPDLLIRWYGAGFLLPWFR